MAAPPCQSYVAAMPSPERLRRQSLRHGDRVGPSKPPQRVLDETIQSLGPRAVNGEIGQHSEVSASVPVQSKRRPLRRRLSGAFNDGLTGVPARPREEI